LEDIGKLIQKEKYTRYPVVEGDKDNVLGVINAKEIFGAYVAASQGNTTDTFNLQDYLRPVIMVIETLPIKDLLFKMQKERHQIAILVDEYGGTSGLVSMEDIVEEIVGDISDEYESEETPDFIQLDNNHYRLHGRMLTDDVNDVFGLDLDEDTVDTIGGWILNEKYDIKVGEEITYKNTLFKVIQKEKNSIEAIDIFLESVTEE
ncbi:transporter associated domain-containing protein, partial [Jeotgalibaca porci]